MHPQDRPAPLTGTPGSRWSSRRRGVGSIVLAASALIVLGACGSSDSSSSGANADSAGSGAAASSAASSSALALAPFDSVAATTGTAVAIEVAEGASQSVTVEYASDYSGKPLKVSVDGTTLMVDHQDGVTSGSAVVRAVVPSITSLTADEGSNISGSGSVDTLQVRADEGSNLALGDLQVKNLTVTLDEGSNGTVYASESITGSVQSGSNLVVTGSPTKNTVTASEGSNITAR
jgi:hypothetical protein